MAKSLDLVLHFETQEELDLFIKGFNNAIVAYDDIVFALRTGCDIPRMSRWGKYTSVLNADGLSDSLKVLIKHFKEEIDNG